MDADAPVWLDADAGSADAKAFIRFHTGGPIVDDLDKARFAIALTPGALDYGKLSIGTDQYPDRSATLLLGLPALSGGREATLAGPGIQTTSAIAPQGELDGFWRAWSRNRALYPLGFDAFFFAGEAALGLPRGVTAELSEA